MYKTEQEDVFVSVCVCGTGVLRPAYDNGKDKKRNIWLTAIVVTIYPHRTLSIKETTQQYLKPSWSPFLSSVAAGVTVSVLYVGRILTTDCARDCRLAVGSVVFNGDV
jgi:hypothetical protein